MIDAIARIGALTLAESMPKGLEQFRDLSPADRAALGSLIEPPRADKVLVLVFERNRPRYVRYHVEDCRDEDPLRYLYRSGPPNGPLALPYGFLTEKLKDKDRAAGKLVKTVRNRLVGWANAIREERDRYRAVLSDAEIAWLQDIAAEIDAQQRTLSNVVDEIQDKSSAKTRLFLTLAFADDDDLLPLGAPSLPFARLFLARSRARLFESKERLGTCSLCGRETQVSPKLGSDIFAFATFDQPTYVAGGLDRDAAWRSFPLCADCYYQADRGRRYTEAHLTRRIGTGSSALSYWVVPSLLSSSTTPEASREILDLLARQSGAGHRLSASERRVLLDNENDLLFELKELRDYISFSLIFVERVQARERILLTVDDILPSRLRRLFEIKTDLEKRAHDLGYLRPEWEFTLSRHLLPLCEVDRGGNKTELRRPDFLAILDHLFRGVPLEASYLADVFVGPLRTRFVAWRAERSDDQENERRFRDAARASWLIWDFLDRLDIIRHEGEPDHMNVTSVDQLRPSGPYFAWLEDFFDHSPRSFQHDAAKVAFLLGSLSDSVREVQLQNLQSAPFTKYLKSLKMEQRDLLELLPRITQKLTEYDAYRGRNRQMLEAASYYLTRAGIDPWPLTAAEINLLFSMGMNLGFLIRRGPEKSNDSKTTNDGEKPRDDF